MILRRQWQNYARRSMTCDDRADPANRDIGYVADRLCRLFVDYASAFKQNFQGVEQFVEPLDWIPHLCPTPPSWPQARDAHYEPSHRGRIVPGSRSADNGPSHGSPVRGNPLHTSRSCPRRDLPPARRPEAKKLCVPARRGPSEGSPRNPPHRRRCRASERSRHGSTSARC